VVLANPNQQLYNHGVCKHWLSKGCSNCLSLCCNYLFSSIIIIVIIVIIIIIDTEREKVMDKKICDEGLIGAQLGWPSVFPILKA
jgi:hypothetical protein